MDSMDVKQFDEIMQRTFGPQIIKQGLKIMAYERGINTYSKRTQQCMRLIERWSEEFMPMEQLLEQLLDIYGLEEQNTRLDGAKALFEQMKNQQEGSPQ